MAKPTIEITNGVFYNTIHPNRPNSVIKVGDVFKVDSIGADGSAKYRAMYGSTMRDVSLDGKYWRLAAPNKFDTEYHAEFIDCDSCTCDIMVLMSVGCKCGWLAEEKKMREGRGYK